MKLPPRAVLAPGLGPSAERWASADSPENGPLGKTMGFHGLWIGDKVGI